MKIQLTVPGLDVDDKDVVNPDDFNFYGRMYVIYGEFGTLAVVFADNLEDAIDEAIDAGKLDGYKVSKEELDAMPEEEVEELLCGGNASDFFDETYLRFYESRKPVFSLAVLLSADEGIPTHENN